MDNNMLAKHTLQPSDLHCFNSAPKVLEKKHNHKIHYKKLYNSMQELYSNNV
jgi:hypothetical protein